MTSLATNMYEYDVDVAIGDIDEMGHVNNAVYLTWVQAAVLRHGAGLPRRRSPPRISGSP